MSVSIFRIAKFVMEEKAFSSAAFHRRSGPDDQSYFTTTKSSSFAVSIPLIACPR